MAVSIGGGIVKDGLVFHLTQNNINAYRGKPTTNYYKASYPDYVAYSTGTPVVTRIGPVTKLESSTGVTSNAISWSGGTFGANANTNAKLSYSMRVRGVGRAYLQVHQSNTSPNSGHAGISSGWFTLTDNWQTVYLRDFYHANNVTAINMLIYIEAGGGNYVEFKDVQIEFNDFNTPYVDGTRATTGVFYDATGNHTINAASMNYPTDGTANFTAQAHNITVDSNTFTMPLEKTLSIWIKSDRSLSATDNWEVGFVNQGSVSGSMFGFMYGVGSCQDLGYWGYGSPYDMSVESTTNKWSSDGNWHNGVITMDASRNVRVYVDGVAKQFLKHSDYTTLVDYVTMPTNTTNYFLINSRGAWSGMTYVNLDDVMVYDRALTAKEVAQNYEAGRALHGL